MTDQPHGEDRIEQSILGGILINDGPLPESVIDLEPEYFSNILHSRIFAAMSDLIEQMISPDEVSVSKQLVTNGEKPMMVYLAELAGGVVTNANLGHWAKLLGNSGRQRKILENVRDATERTKNLSAGEIESAVIEAIGNVRKPSVWGFSHARESVGLVLDAANSAHDNPESLAIVKTGITGLDQLVKLKAGEMTTIAARPSMGKSALAANIARNAAKNISIGPVAVVSLEDSKTNLMTRVISSIANIDSNKFPEAVKKGELVEACQEVYDLNLTIADPSSVTIDEIRRALLRLGEVSLLVIDYLQLIKILFSKDNHSLNIGKITKAVKALGKDKNCHTILLSQLNRGLESRTPPIPRLSDLKESGSIEEDSDNIIFIYRENYYDSAKPIYEADLIVAKQRNGPTGIVPVHWSPTTQTFSDLKNQG